MSVPSPGSSHDIVLLNSSASPYGYMTYPNTTHRGVVDAFRKAIGGSDNPRYQDLSTVKVHAQTDWHNGHGRDRFEEGTFLYNENSNPRASNKLTSGPDTLEEFGEASATVVAPMDFIQTFINPTASVMMFAVMSNGRTFTKSGPLTTGWHTASTFQFPPFTTVVPITAGTPSIDYVAFGRASTAGFYTQYPCNSASLTAAPNVWHKVCMHRGLIYTSQYNEISCNSLASPFFFKPVKSIGNKQTTITSLYSLRNMLFVGKEDGLWAIEDTDATVIVPYKIIDYSSNSHVRNFKYMIEKEGNIVASAVTDLWEISGDFSPTGNRTISAIGPFHKKKLPRKYYGEISGLIKDTSNIIVSVDAGASGQSGIYINNGGGWSNLRTPGETLIGLASLGLGQRITCLSNVIGSPYSTSPKIYFGQFDTMSNTPGQFSHDIMSFKHFDIDGDNFLLVSDGQEFESPGKTVMLFDADLPTIVKWFDSITLAGTISESGQSVTVSYSLDPTDLDNITWTDLTSVTTVGRTDATEITFPAGIVAKRIALKITFTRGTTAYLTPEIEAMTVKYLARPDQNKAYRYSLDVWRESDQRLLSGVETLDMQERSDALFDIHAAQVPVTLYRSNGNASPPNVTGHRVVISDIDEAEVIPNRKTGNTHPRGLRTNVTFIEV